LQIDTSTGAFAFQDHDLDIQGGPLPVSLSRYYNGHSGQVGELGYRWTHSYDTHLALTADPTGDIGVVFGSGKEEYFGHNQQTGVFSPADGRVHDTLAANPDGTFTFTAVQGNLAYHFSSAGQLLTIGDLHNNAITLAYDGSNRLATVKDPGGRALTFGYNANNRIACFSYSVPANGLLSGSSLAGAATSGATAVVLDVTGKITTGATMASASAAQSACAKPGSGVAIRKIRVTLTRTTYLNYAYFTDRETQDPSFNRSSIVRSADSYSAGVEALLIRGRASTSAPTAAPSAAQSAFTASINAPAPATSLPVRSGRWLVMLMQVGHPCALRRPTVPYRGARDGVSWKSPGFDGHGRARCRRLSDPAPAALRC